MYFLYLRYKSYVLITFPLQKTICWAIIFIPRLTFPPGSSIAKVILDQLSMATLIEIAHTVHNTFLNSAKKAEYFAPR